MQISLVPAFSDLYCAHLESNESPSLLPPGENISIHILVLVTIFIQRNVNMSFKRKFYSKITLVLKKEKTLALAVFSKVQDKRAGSRIYLL